MSPPPQELLPNSSQNKSTFSFNPRRLLKRSKFTSAEALAPARRSVCLRVVRREKKEKRKSAACKIDFGIEAVIPVDKEKTEKRNMPL